MRRYQDFVKLRPMPTKMTSFSLLDTLPSNSTAFLIPAQATAISQPRTSFLRDKNYYDRPTEEGRARFVSMDGGVEAEISFLCLF